MSAPAAFRQRLALRRVCGTIFAAVCGVLSLLGLALLSVLLIELFRRAGGVLSLEFLQRVPSRIEPGNSGVRPALLGTAWMVAITAIVAIPVGVGAAVYLQEYARRGWFSRLVTLNIANLAGVPSIVYGILGLVVFVRAGGAGRSLLAAGLTLALLVLPVIIIAAREALLAVPQTLRDAAYALGATRWQTIWHHVLPAAMPGILTGVILALSRAVGEAAPILLIGALAFNVSAPGELYEGGSVLGWLQSALLGDFSALPIQIYIWTDEADPEFHRLAAGCILVLLAVLLTMNSIAVALRAWHQRGGA